MTFVWANPAPHPLPSWEYIFVTGLLLWLFLVRTLRHRRAQAMTRLYAPAGRESFRRMTAEDAQFILKTLAELEFPSLYGLSMVVAIFRTYGIPTISSLLVWTGQLKDNETVTKRAADTGVLLLEFGLNKPTSERAIEAISRMNYLHDLYRKSGKISNDDLLYTLGIFALEPSRWINRYEWRSLTDVEMCACGTFWKNMGDAMEIPYTKLHSNGEGWQDGLEWLKELEAWSNEYEEAHMVAAESNRQLANAQLDPLLPKWPPIFHKICKQVVIVLLGERLRRSMKYAEASPIVYSLVNGTLYIRKLLLRHFALPRPAYLRNQWIEAGPDDRKRHYVLFDYLVNPWYVRPTFMRRWGPRACISKVFGYKIPGDDGDKYHPKGYTFGEVGPHAFRGKGRDEMKATRTRLKRANMGGCPFGHSK